MIHVIIPGRGDFKLENLLLDMNGTLTVDGVLPVGVKERIELLKKKLSVYMLTADTFGTGAKVAEDLGIKILVVSQVNGTKDKKEFLRNLGVECTAAIGNGSNDMEMLQYATLAIAIIGKEGCALDTLRQADIVVTDINNALDLLIKTKRLVATLRV